MLSRFSSMCLMGTGSHGHLYLQDGQKNEYLSKRFQVPVTGLDQSQLCLFSVFIPTFLVLFLIFHSYCD